MEEESPEIELPRAIALAWGVAANPQRGPKRELSIEGIVDAAVAIADEKGLAAVSMSSVASALGFTTMSLYRYVTAKEDLILLMQEHGVGLPPLRISEAATWREGLTAYFEEMLGVYLAHPWLLDIPIVGIPNTPNNLAWMESGMAAMRETPLDWQSRMAAGLLVMAQVRFQGLVERGYADRARSTGIEPNDNDIADAHILANLVTDENFPILREAIQSGVFGDPDDDPFAFGLARILDGIGVLIDNWTGEVPTNPTWEEPSTDGFPKDEAVTAARVKRREAEVKLREARRRELELIRKAREKQKKRHEAEAKAAAKKSAG